MSGRIAFGFVVLALSFVARAATLEGTVTDIVSMSPIRNVVVKVFNENKQEIGTGGQTDKDGNYVVENLPGETVIEIEFSKNGYIRNPQPRASKTTNDTVTVHCRLAQRTAPVKYYRDFAAALLASEQTAAGAKDIRDLYDALPPQSQATVRAEVEAIRRRERVELNRY